MGHDPAKGRAPGKRDRLLSDYIFFSMLDYRTYGSANGTPLCFLHGFMGSSDDWRPIVEDVSKRAFVVTIDLPGHGQSLDRPDHLYTMEGVTQAVLDILDEIGIRRCVLIGYSMGGRAALYAARYHQSRVRGLVLESASPGLSSTDERMERRRVDARRADRIESDLGAFLEDWYRQPLFASLAEHDLIEEMVAIRRQNDASELARALRGLSPAEQPPLWEDLGRLEVPVLLVTGALDEKYVRITQRASERIPRAKRVVVPHAGHNVHAERPQTYSAHLTNFLFHSDPEGDEEAASDVE